LWEDLEKAWAEMMDLKLWDDTNDEDFYSHWSHKVTGIMHTWVILRFLKDTISTVQVMRVFPRLTSILIFFRRCGEQKNKIVIVQDSWNIALTLSHALLCIYRQYKILSDPVTPSVEQYCVTKFPVKEEVKLAEILQMLSARYGEEQSSCTSLYEWCTKFFEDCEEAANWPHAHIHHRYEHLSCWRVDFGE
jgi:hypothetical protein